MESKMEQNSGEMRSREAMNIFAQSIDVRRPGKSRRTRRAIHKKFSPATANDSPARPSLERLLHQRRAIVTEQERGRAESELSRATGMAQELEQQIEQVSANGTARSPHRSSELQRTRASGSGSSSRRKKPGLAVAVDAEAPGADPPRDQSNTLLVEVMQELDRVKRELRDLQREVKAAREAKADGDAETPTPTPTVTSPGSRALDGAEREAGEENDEERCRGIPEIAVAGGFREDVQAMRALADVLRRDRSLGASDPDEERFATASSSDVGLESEDMALVVVPATEEPTSPAVTNAESALTVARHMEHEHDDDDPSSRRQAELTSARVELESIKEEGARFTGSVERTRMETASVTEEIDRLVEQEERARAQVQQLNARLHRARSRLDVATATDERAEAALAELSAALRQLSEETEAAEKERALTELENQCVREDAGVVGAEIVAVEQSVRESVKKLEAARATEAVATAKLRAAVEAATLARTAGVMAAQQTSGYVTIARFEYEYLSARPEVVRTVAEKKAAAAEAWAEALRAGEKEIEMRVEMIEKEMAEARDATDGTSGEVPEPRVAALQRAQTLRRPALRGGVETETSGTTGTPSSLVVHKQRPPSFSVKSRKMTTVASKYLKLVTGKCGG